VVVVVVVVVVAVAVAVGVGVAVAVGAVVVVGVGVGGQMKRSAIKRKGATHWKKALDSLCRQVVLVRDKKCAWCGKSSGLQWAHVRSRRHLSTRWDTRNSLMLDAGCHLRWHHSPLVAVAWFNEKYPERAKALRLFDQGVLKGKLDRELIRLVLESELKRYA
jgi:hypothetical protein